MGKFLPKQNLEYSPEEKIKHFDQFHQFAWDAWDYFHSQKTEIKDVKQHAYEMVMDLLGTGVWEAKSEIL